MKTNITLSLIAAAGIALGGILPHATAAPHRPYGERPAMMERFSKALDLSSEQADKIKAEVRAEKENLVPTLQKLRDARQHLRETIQAGPDEKAIRAAHAKVAELEADLAVERAKIRAKVIPHLTEEQLQKLEKIEARFDEMTAHNLERFEKRLED